MLFYYSIFAAAITVSLVNGLQKKIVIKRKISSTLGKYLRGHVFKTTTNAIDPQHCLADCWAENDRCQSFNFLVQLQKCELNEASNLTNPDDYIDRPWIVYLTNPAFGRQQKPLMERHTKSYPEVDPCTSNPCVHAESCVQDLELGYRCQQCHSNYHGPKCEEHIDPCISNPCRYGGTCISNMTSWRCACPFPFHGSVCQDNKRSYTFDLNGSGDYPYHRIDKFRLENFILNFWFKTAEPNTSYFIHHTPEKSSDTERLAVWRNGNTFFVELWKDYVYNFTFPLSYPVNNNHWRLVTIILRRNAELSFFLDGVMRESPKLTKGTPGAKDLYVLVAGTVRLGYFKDSNGREHFFNGSIGSVDIKEAEQDWHWVIGFVFRRCIPGLEGLLAYIKWVGLSRLARPVDCSTRVPFMGIYAYRFSGTTHSLEQNVSPPKDLTAFTLIFQAETNNGVVRPYQMACYGNEGEDCHLSVVINTNFTLGITIESTRFNVDLLPINDGYVHFFIMTWTNDGGVFQLIIDGMLQSILYGIETNGKISGQSRFIVGRNFIDQIHNLNIWDRVLSDEMLYMMTSQPGDEPGNVVAWKDFKTPENIPDAESQIYQRTDNFRVQSAIIVGDHAIVKLTVGINSTSSDVFEISPKLEILHVYYWALQIENINDENVWSRNSYTMLNLVGANNFKVKFSEPFPSYIKDIRGGCCGNHYEMTLAMWLYLKQSATIFSLREIPKDDPSIVLKILSEGNITFFFKGRNASLGEAHFNGWSFLAFSWSATGDLYRNLNGVYKHISFNFASGERYSVNKKGGTIIGDEESESILGVVTQFNFWHYALPPSALMALSRGINGIGAPGVNWNRYSGSCKGNAQLVHTISTYNPDFIALKKRDQHCNDVLDPANCVGKYRARFGMSNQGYHWGCFCEENLSKDMNFNHGEGDYSENKKLLEII